jgi:hypothetical protein
MEEEQSIVVSLSSVVQILWQGSWVYREETGFAKL